jgi:hypothetical protein
MISPSLRIVEANENGTQLSVGITGLFCSWGVVFPMMMKYHIQLILNWNETNVFEKCKILITLIYKA